MRCLLLSLLAAALSSCASIAHGSKQFVNIKSNPDATMILDGKTLPMKSPATIQVSRSRHGHMLRLEAPGYQPAELYLIPRESDWTWANFLIGGLPGLIVDYSTGSAWYYDETLIYNLAPLPEKIKK